MKQIQFHPLADLFPLVPSVVADLADDIKNLQLNDVIITYEGKILDGRHRYEACQVAGVKPRFEQFKGESALAFVISKNLKRRHLDASQRAMIAAKIETMERGRPSQIKDAKLQLNRTEAAEKLNVSPRSVATAKKIIGASIKLADNVSAGEISLNAAEKIIDEKKAAKETPETLDEIGRVIPKEIIEDWNHAKEVGGRLRSLISEIKTTLERGINDEGLPFRELCNPIVAECNALRYSLSVIIPHAVCPSCQGRNRKNCTLCKKRGWLSKFLWNSPNVSEATKKIILASVKGKQ